MKSARAELTSSSNRHRYCRERSDLMSIKSDRWIKRMALEHQMIEPFVESQTRAGVVSYGVSSYGYDIRVGDEFKVFTNIYNTVVDPKNFDPKSFVDIKADVCIIPPNSFALAQHHRVLPDSARHPDRLPWQVHLRPLRHHRQRDAVRAGVGRTRRRSRSRTRRRCRRRFTQTRGSRRCCSSRATSRARSRTATRRGSTRLSGV